MTSPEVNILVTGEQLIGSGVRSIEAVLKELLISAESRIVIAAYSLSPFAEEVMALLRDSADRGVSVSILASKIPGGRKSLWRELRRLSKRYRNFTFRLFPKELGLLHAKVVAVDGNRAIVGSANLTWGGLVSNHEIALLISGSVAFQLSSMLEGLISKLDNRPRD